MKFDWTDETMQRLRELAETGHSAASIARELGGDCLSRNAVIGRCHRLGIRLGRREEMLRQANSEARLLRVANGGVKAFSSHAPAPKPRKNVAPPVDFRTPKKKAEERLSPRPVRLAPHAPDAVVIPMTQRVHILDLENHHCKAVIGDPKDLTYCGGERMGSESYCRGHCVAFYQPDWAAKLRNKGRFVGVE